MFIFPSRTEKKALSMLKRYKWVLKYAVTVKSKVIFIVSGILGIRLTSLLINGIKKIIENENINRIV